MKRFLFFGIVLLFFSQVASAQDFWMQKSYKRWTKEEIVRLISDSPWSQVAGDTGNAQIRDAAYVTVRLRSSILIRQALVRLKQIESGYDKFEPAKKIEFDEKMKGTLECPACQENYVVTISPPVADRQLKSAVFGLVNLKFEQLKDTVYLVNDKGEKRKLVHFQAAMSNDGEATLFFPRLDENGAKLLTGESKTVTLIFETKGLPNFQVPRSTIFDVTKAMIDGNVEF
ncbi:MAG: hypothetical protein IPN69_09400 [Acidobacteria bacterium]|nr:hypothetical protein [Acidobacteriota bacterium]MBK8150526.1 hypothetical protein [Acidobacteriota bacterium]MBK8810931.1 hypothetical protein [Acidobacteriota bacterium]